MHAREIMSGPVHTISEGASMAEAIRLMQEKGVSGLPVVDASGRMVGIITHGDVLRHVRHETPLIIDMLGGNYIADLGDTFEQKLAELKDLPVSRVMTRKVITVGPEMDLEDIAGILTERKIKRVPVTEEGRAIGMISQRDIVRAIASSIS